MHLYLIYDMHASPIRVQYFGMSGISGIRYTWYTKYINIFFNTNLYNFVFSEIRFPTRPGIHPIHPINYRYLSITKLLQY
jgi:hypothetical protein